MIDWEAVFHLHSDSFSTDTSLDLYWNDPTSADGFYLLIPGRCKARRNLRVVSDPVPQADGEIFHRRFRNGTEFDIVLQLWDTPEDFACGTSARVMTEKLIAYLDSILNGRGRLYWQPEGYGDQRMLDAARWLTPISYELENGVWTLSFTLDSPLPYVKDSTEVLSADSLVPDSSPTNLILPTYSSPYWPVIRVQGAFTAFTITNADVLDEYGDPLQIVYDGTRPGASGVSGGHYAEVNTFTETVYLDGNSANLKPGIDPLQTDYFFLKPGDNHITSSGAAAQFLINYSWAVG